MVHFQGTLGTGPGPVWVNAIQVHVSQNYGFAEMPMPISLLSAPNGFTPDATSISTQFDRDIVLVLDRSLPITHFCKTYNDCDDGRNSE